MFPGNRPGESRISWGRIPEPVRKMLGDGCGMRSGIGQRRHRQLAVAIVILVAGFAVLPASAEGGEVTLTFETAPGGEPWDDPTDTDFGHVSFDVYDPRDAEERPAPVRPSSTGLRAVTNYGADGTVGWLIIRFAEPQESVAFWSRIDARDYQVDDSGRAPTVHIRAYDPAGDRVYDSDVGSSGQPVTRYANDPRGGGWSITGVSPDDPSAEISRIEMTIRKYQSADFARFGLTNLEFRAEAPTAAMAVSPSTPKAGERLTLDARGVETAGQIVTYEWYVDGAAFATTTRPVVSYTPENPGPHQFRVRVTDGLGQVDEDAQTVDVRERSLVNTPGFGFVIAFLAIIAVALVAWTRLRRSA